MRRYKKENLYGIFALVFSGFFAFVQYLFLIMPIIAFPLGTGWTFGLTLILMFVALIIPFAYEIMSIILMPWGLYVIATSTQDWFSILYYIVFVIWAFCIVVRIIFIISCARNREE